MLRTALPLLIVTLVPFGKSTDSGLPVKTLPNTEQGEINNATSKGICTTQECVIAAANLLESMDQTADPCQDFFQYACGGWVRKHPIPDSKYSWTQFDVLDEQLYGILEGILREPENSSDVRPVNAARDLFTACMDTVLLDTIGLKPLTDLLASFGGWPMTLDNWSGQFNWKEATVASLQLYKNNYFLNVFIKLDTNDTSRNSIYVDQGSLGLPRAILVNPERSAEAMVAYTTFAREAAKLIRNFLGSFATDEQIDTEVDEMLRFESALAQLTSPPEYRRNNTRLYNPMLVSDMQLWTDNIGALTDNGKIDWDKYFNDIFSLASLSVDATEKVIVRETEYLKKLLTLLDATPTRTIANYIHWRFVIDLGHYTNTEMENLTFHFAKVYLGVAQQESRSTKCSKLANSLLSFALGAKYVAVAFDEEAKIETESMVYELKAAFQTLVKDAMWMDNITKSYAQEKVDYMTELIGYPDWILNDTSLESYYDGLEVAVDTHFLNIQSANKVNNAREYKELRQQADRLKWRLPPPIVNAAYDSQRNSIVFPAGILQPPFFGKGRLAAINYGGMGAVIGHEITHGFDDRGRQNDRDGNIADWWTPETASNYLERAQCFIDQYSNFTVPSGSRVNGFITQGENIADNGGLREAFRAYNVYLAEHGAEEPQLPGFDEFSAEQIFFLSFANIWCGQETSETLEAMLVSGSHSPNRYRVLGSLANNEDFARHFNCATGTPMSRETKCVIW